MVYQEPGRALNPTIKVGRQVAEVFELAGRSEGAGARPLPGDAREGPDLRSGRRDEPLSPPALGRDAPARGDRDGARVRAVAADPRRADDRARRDRRGRGARPDLGAPTRVRDLAPVHQPQPRRDREDVRPRRRALRRRAGRGGAGARGVQRPAPSVHGRACCAASRAATRSRRTERSTRFPARCRRPGWYPTAASSPTGAVSSRTVAARRRRRCTRWRPPGSPFAVPLPRARADAPARDPARARGCAAASARTAAGC